jgi:GH15 family glucan-1,4-alpha-glucosidase
VADASLLLMSRYGFCAPNDARMRATYEFIQRELGRGPLLYRLGPGFDRMPSGEGAFLIASFWAVEYLAQCGEIEQARRRFERLLAFANDVGLYAEEIDTGNGAALGNFPQAFSHVGVIVAAMTLQQEQQRRERAHA